MLASWYYSFTGIISLVLFLFMIYVLIKFHSQALPSYFEKMHLTYHELGWIFLGIIMALSVAGASFLSILGLVIMFLSIFVLKSHDPVLVPLVLAVGAFLILVSFFRELLLVLFGW